MPVPVIDKNTQAQSYTHLQVEKPYITLDSENMHHDQTTGIKNMQKNRLGILLWRTLYSETQVKIKLQKHNKFW